MGEEKSSPSTHPVGHKEEKVWGSWEILSRGEGYQIKLLTFNPGAEMSLQTHRHRSEMWTVVSGFGKAMIGMESPNLYSEEAWVVPQGVPHWIKNAYLEPLIILEIQFGAYLGEDDLIRISDANGRTLGEVDPSNES